MQISRLTPLCLIGCMLGNASASPLYDYLKQARKNAVELDVPLFEVAQYTYEAAQLEGAYDTTVFANMQSARDTAEQISRFSGDSREQDRWEIGAKRYFASGTNLSVTYEHERSSTDFPAPSDPVQLPDGSYIAGTDPSSTVRYNPAYARRLTFEVRQNLWRNFWSKELDLRQEIARSARIEPRFRHGLTGQAMQYETESLFWSLAALESKLELAGTLLKTSENFAKQMRRREKLGRADSVDVAASVSGVIQRESLLLQLQIALEQTSGQLTTRLWGQKQTSHRTLVNNVDLTQPQLPLPAEDVQEAWQIAQAQRFDLRMLRSLEKVTEQKKALASETGKPEVSFFALWRTNGLSDDVSVASTEAENMSEKLTKVVGLSFQMPLGNTAATAQSKSAHAEQKVLQARQQTIARDIQRDLQQAYKKLDGAQRQVKLRKDQVKSLEKTRNKEQQKLRQARTDQVAVLRYDMEVISARIDWVDALAQQRQIEADIRFLTHAYPKE